MLQRKVEELLEIIDGKSIDFYLEDDMFELEGLARKEDGCVTIEVLDGVGHMLELAGNKLVLFLKNGRLHAEKIDKSKTFEMEINRIYYKLENPVPLDFEKLEEEEQIHQFFKKETDTLVWRSEEKDRWMIEINKINMYFSGERFEYPTLQQLFAQHKELLSGSWQAVKFSAEVEE